VACPANFLELTTIRDFVWIKTKDFQPRQIFGSHLQFSRPRAGKTLAAKSCAKYLACQFWQGLAEASSKHPLKLKGWPKNWKGSGILAFIQMPARFPSQRQIIGQLMASIQTGS
jgi:hypothetical protein